MKKTITIIGTVVVGLIVLLFVFTGFIALVLWLSNLFNITHQLGIDTQTSHNYAFSSGTGPMIIAVLGFSGIAVTVIKHLNCEVPGCWRLGHTHPDHGRPVCRKHYHHDVVPHVS